MNVYEAQRQHVGRQIKKARKASGLSHDKLAAQVGTSRQHLIRLEKGLHAPRPEMLKRIADATGRDEEYFTADEIEGDADDEESDVCVVLTSALRRFVRAEVRELA